MADVYVRSGAGGAATGADWANAYLTLGAALTAKAAGDTFWVAADHAETQATAMTMTCPGTAASPCMILCADHTGSVPPVAADLRTTATITTTGANAIILNGFCYVYGITFNVGTGSVAAGLGLAAGAEQTFNACTLKLVNTGGSTATVLLGTTSGNTASALRLINTTMSFANVAQGILPLISRFTWQATPSALAGSAPTALFKGGSSNRACVIMLDGVDVSAATALVDVMASPVSFIFRDCKVPAGTLQTVPTNPGGAQADFVNCNNGAINYTASRSRYQGILTTDATVVRTGGASDGTTPISWKIVTTANNKRISPFECFEIDTWVDSTSASTATVEVLTSGVTLTNADIWADVFYLSSAGSPLAARATSEAATIITAGSNLTTSTETWTGLGSPSPQKIAISFTPGMKGFARIRVYIAKVSATIYVCPKVAIT